MKVVSLLSGGLDSSVLLAHLLSEGHAIRALSFYYGQRHARELDAAGDVAAHYGVPHTTRTIPPSWLADSSLTGVGEVPEGHYEDQSMKATVVPGRNLLFVTVAATMALREGCDAVAFAPHSGDHAIYPDCRDTFVNPLEEVLAHYDYTPLRLLTPFLGRTKTGVVKRGAELGVPFERTWSCYKGGTRHCGRCGTCAERREAFQQSGVTDPTQYEGD